MRLAEDYAAESSRRRAAAAGDTVTTVDTSGSASMSAGIASLVTGLGIVNPVTKAAAGGAYLEEVARQLAVFLRWEREGWHVLPCSLPYSLPFAGRPVLERCGGLMTLADAYSMYNRARHTDLVSPDDLVAAAKLLGPLRLGMSLHTFPSRLVVVRLDSFSPQAVAQRLRDLLRTKQKVGGSYAYISALDLSSAWCTPLQIAAQLLLVSRFISSIASHIGFVWLYCLSLLVYVCRLPRVKGQCAVTIQSVVFGFLITSSVYDILRAWFV